MPLRKKQQQKEEDKTERESEAIVKDKRWRRRSDLPIAQFYAVREVGFCRQNSGE